MLSRFSAPPADADAMATRAAFIVVGVVLAALCALPAPAGASSVRTTAEGLEYSAGPGETNTVEISTGHPVQNVAYIEDSVPITPGEGCDRGSGPSSQTD